MLTKILTFFLIFSSSTFASEIMDAKIKSKTLELCQEITRLSDANFTQTIEPIIPIRFLTKSFSRTFNGFDFSYDTEADLFLNQNISLFKQTLHECYPDKKLFRSLIIPTMKLSIYEGRALAIMAHLGLFKGFTFLMQKLATKSQKLATIIGVNLVALFGYSIYKLDQKQKETAHSGLAEDEKILNNIQKGEIIASKSSHNMQVALAGIDQRLLKNIDRKIDLIQIKLAECNSNCGQLERVLSTLMELKASQDES